MTIGQRIAALRKERHYSQEELGGQLGVSRQSIYKWESDASIPEIDKLIALSKLFGVSVGWLLGVEETPAAEPDTQPEELTETQLKMVEEIAGRYAQALPRQRRLSYLVGIVSAVVVAVVTTAVACGALLHLNSKYDDLENQISAIESSVDGKIDSIVDRVEETLDEKNNLLSNYSASVASCDPAANTVTFSLQAVPKAYVEGMTAIFCATQTASGETVEVSGALGGGQQFAAALTCPLSDDITLSVIFGDGEKRETQQLEQYTGLYTQTLPILEIDAYVDIYDTYPKQEGTKLLKGDIYVLKDERGSSPVADGRACQPAKVRSVQAGVFLNKKLLAWAQPGERPKDRSSNEDYDAYDYYQFPTMTTPLKDGDELAAAAIVTDEYGRTLFYVESQSRWVEEGRYRQGFGERCFYPSNMDEWTF